MGAAEFAVAPQPVFVEFNAKITPVVIFYSIMVSTGGLMFGYDIGISGGLTSTPSFLKKFFPLAFEMAQKREKENNNYCKYENRGLQVFTSALYLTALTSTFLASHTTRHMGRKRTMLFGGLFFIVGTILSAAASSYPILILGRISLGCGVGFASQATPLFLSEIAPTRIRGALTNLFQFNVTLGILFGNFTIYTTSRLQNEWGWRLCLALAGVPALLFTVGTILVEDTPNSLIERGHLERGKLALIQIRGTDDIEAEYLEIVKASRIAQEVEYPFADLLMGQNGPPLVIAIMFQVFQQFTGINAIMLYTPLLFKTLGFGNNAPLYSAIITGVVNVLATSISIYSVDKIGRRMLLLEAGVQMFISQTIIAIILALKVQDTTNTLSHGMAIVVVLMLCTFVSSFAWSWGPLGWLLPSETFPLETRSAGLSVTVCVNMMFTFLIAQSFPSMLCQMKFGIFLFFSGWVLVMSLFVFFLLPETKGIPIEEMTERVWKQHWFWNKFMDDGVQESEDSD
ncbi:sugar transport protein 13-like [Benincasa hispida]|uniref:sugar transport protein 13-like n=1 Tax=Benincasa hispida TaxID=102211 RepID=UPI0019017452|nr:sugar transport protein 13-like [Benincasa hispida]